MMTFFISIYCSADCCVHWSGLGDLSWRYTMWFAGSHALCGRYQGGWYKARERFVKMLGFSLPRQWPAHRMKVINVRLQVFNLSNDPMLLFPNQIKALAWISPANASSSDWDGYRLIILAVNKIDHGQIFNYSHWETTAENMDIIAQKSAPICHTSWRDLQVC